jgi:hypothetical protein
VILPCDLGVGKLLHETTHMTAIKYAKPARIWLKAHPMLDERWLQRLIADDPALLGLGDLVLKDKERPQARAGRLDLLLQDADSDKRYEVEIQLGRTDEAHIIRTIEYWDIERKRYPQYEHAAVIVAEDITSRFLNVIGLFNGSIPLIAIQLSVLQLGDTVTVHCTRVLDELQLGLVDEDEGLQPVTDRQFWETHASKESVRIADDVFELVRRLDSSLALNYMKRYIGLTRNGQPDNFVLFKPKKEWLRFEVKLEKSDEVQALLEASGLDLMGWSWGRYKMRLEKADVAAHRDTLMNMIAKAYAESS